MKIRVKEAVLGSLVCLAFGVAWIIGCCDKSQNPVEPREYYIYFSYDKPTNYYYRYDTGTGAIDSFYLPYRTDESGFAISPDGRKMYLSPANAGLIAEIDLESHVVIAEHPISITEQSVAGRWRDVEISPDSRYVAIVDGYLHIIDMAGYGAIYSDTTYDYSHGRFTSDGSVFLCAGRSTDYMERFILEVEIRPNVVATKRPFPSGWPNRIVPNATNSRWYILSWIFGDAWQVAGYDPIQDSIVFGKSFAPGGGDLEIMPDERYLIYSQPGNLNSDTPPPLYFTIYDIALQSVDRQVSAYVDSLGIVYPISELCLTPDGRHLIGIGREDGQLFDYDMYRHIFNRYIYIGGGMFKMPLTLTCQSRP
jgi:hypothetical protein